MTSTSIRLPQEIAAASKAEAQLMHRSQAGQVEHWVRIGRAVEHSGQFNYNRVARALRGALPVDDLSLYEKAVFDVLHDETMQNSTGYEQRLLAQQLASIEDAGIDIDSLGD